MYFTSTSGYEYVCVFNISILWFFKKAKHNLDGLISAVN